MGSWVFFDASAASSVVGEGRPAGGDCGAGSVGEFSRRHRGAGADAGRGKEEQGRAQAVDAIVMFRMLVLRSLYNLSDEQIVGSSILLPSL